MERWAAFWVYSGEGEYDSTLLMEFEDLFTIRDVGDVTARTFWFWGFAFRTLSSFEFQINFGFSFWLILQQVLTSPVLFFDALKRFFKLIYYPCYLCLQFSALVNDDFCFHLLCHLCVPSSLSIFFSFFLSFNSFSFPLYHGAAFLPALALTNFLIVFSCVLFLICFLFLFILHVRFT